MADSLSVATHGSNGSNGSNGSASALAIATIADGPTEFSDGSKPTAILYVPGLRGEPDEAETIVAKLTDALTIYGGDGFGDFAYAKSQAADGAAGPTAAYTISMLTPRGAQAVFDFYPLDYEEHVLGEYLQASPILKALQLVLSLHWLAPALIKTLLRGYRKTASQRRQLWYVLAILLGLALYFVLTVVAIVKIVASALTSGAMNAAGSPPFHFASWFAKLFPSLAFFVGNRPKLSYPLWHAVHPRLFSQAADAALAYGAGWIGWAFESAYYHLVGAPGFWLLAHSALLVVVATAVGLALPKLRTNFESVMNHMLAAIEYFRIGFARNKTTGLFHKSFGDLCKAVDRYDSVHVMGYSFGCIVALDALFYTRGIKQPRIDRLGNLITIGAPITMAQTLWPKHFDVIRNEFTDPSKHAWINVQCALDVLASPILDRENGEFVLEDRSAPNWGAPKTPAWEAYRRTQVEKQERAVQADDGDPNKINFARAVNLDYAGWYPLDLDLAEFFSLAALRAHKMYWTTPGEVDYNAFARIAPELLGSRTTVSRQANPGALRAATS